MTGRRERGEFNWGERWRARWWVMALVLALLSPVGFVTARQLSRTGDSPAVGRAQVVTQGVTNLPDGDVVWRLVERIAQPRGTATVERQVLGYVLASDEPVLLSNMRDGGNAEEIARLAPGESYFVKRGTRQVRASLTDRPVRYLAYELVPVADARDVGDGTLLFVSDAFTAPEGNRDLDLVRNVLPLGESALVPDSGSSVAILATDGAVEVLPSSGRKRTLQPGESALFPAGDLEITAVQPSASAGVRALVAGMTSALQTGPGGAAYVASVIGPEIPPPPAPTATATPLPAPTEPPAPELGSITVTVFNCPPGMNLANLVGESCRIATDELSFALSGPAGDLGLGDASFDGSSFTWLDLPLGPYILKQTALPDGFESYFIPGSAAVGGAPDTGYSVTIDPSAPDIGLQVFNFQPATAGSIAAVTYLCPGIAADQVSPAVCQASTVPVLLSSFATGQVLDGTSASDTGAGYVWAGLPFGEYRVYASTLPRGYGGFVSGGQFYSPQQGGPFVSIDGNQPDASVELFFVMPFIT